MERRSSARSLLVLTALSVVLGGCASPLRRAARSGNVEKVNRLLEQGADPNAADARGIMPLHCAALFGQADAARTLVAKGANFEARESSGGTPLHGRSPTSAGPRILIELGTNVYSKGETPLQLAQRLEVEVGSLLEGAVKHESPDAPGTTAARAPSDAPGGSR